MVAPWDRRSPSEQRRVEGLVLGSWLPQAVTYAPHWATVADGLGLDPQRLEDRDDLRRFPPSRQADVAHSGGPGAPGLLMRPTESQVKARAAGSLLLRIARSIRSEGVAGKRFALLEEFKPVHVHRAGVLDELAIAYSRRDLDRLHRTGARAARVLGLEDTDVLVSTLPPAPSLGWWGTYHLGLGSSMTALHPRGHGEGLDRCAEAFALVPVTAVAVRLDEAVELAAVLTDVGAEVARVRTVVTVGPPPDDERRRAVADAWRGAGAAEDLRVRALWAPGESRSLWAECREGTTGLHTYPDLEVLEVLDVITTEPTDGDGDLTVTSAGWHGTALLRYRTGTWVESAATGACPACGRTVPRLTGELLPEAWQPELGIADVLVRLDLRAVATELATTRGLSTWRVQLDGPDAPGGDDQLVVEVAGDLSERDRELLGDRITRACGVAPARIDVAADAGAVDRAAAEAGSVFADLR